MAAVRKEASSSFLKKRTKKLLSVTGSIRVPQWDSVLNAIDKSFLLLFFKKEGLFLLFSSAHATTLQCGVITPRDDWNKADQHGDLSPFTREICRAIGAASDEPTTITAFAEEEAGLQAVHGNRIDVIVGVTPTPSAQARNDVHFGPVIFYDAIAIMARPGRRPLQPICAAEGSDAESLLSVSQPRPAVFSFQEEGEMESAFRGGRCAGIAATMSRLGQIRAQYGTQLGGAVILQHRLGLIAVTTASRQANPRLGAVVDWTIQALLEAEEAGISQATAAAWQDNGNLAAERLMRAGPWVPRLLQEVGNYGEIFDRTIGQKSPMALPRAENALWTAGGLMAPLPVR